MSYEILCSGEWSGGVVGEIEEPLGYKEVLPSQERGSLTPTAPLVPSLFRQG